MPHDDLTQMKIDIEGLKKDVKYGNDKIDAVHETLTTFIADAEKKFAAKWAERVLIFVGIGIGGILITAIMTLIIK